MRIDQLIEPVCVLLQTKDRLRFRYNLYSHIPKVSVGRFRSFQFRCTRIMLPELPNYSKLLETLRIHVWNDFMLTLVSLFQALL